MFVFHKLSLYNTTLEKSHNSIECKINDLCILDIANAIRKFNNTYENLYYGSYAYAFHISNDYIDYVFNIYNSKFDKQLLIISRKTKEVINIRYHSISNTGWLKYNNILDYEHGICNYKYSLSTYFIDNIYINHKLVKCKILTWLSIDDFTSIYCIATMYYKDDQVYKIQTSFQTQKRINTINTYNKV